MSEQKFWLVWRPASANPEYLHGTLEGAKLEAERLARLHGHAFYVLEAVSISRRIDVMTSDLVDDLPF